LVITDQFLSGGSTRRPCYQRQFSCQLVRAADVLAVSPHGDHASGALCDPRPCEADERGLPAWCLHRPTVSS